jgi:transposase-like protein
MPSSNFSHGPDRSHATASATTPTVCPACRSTAIATTTRNPDENAYWRCSECGEVWNAARRAASSEGARWR